MWTSGLFFKPISELLVFSPSKDCVSSHVCSSFVYKYACSSCQDTFYGKTSRHFIVPWRELLQVNKKGESIKGVSSLIRDHINQGCPTRGPR